MLHCIRELLIVILYFSSHCLGEGSKKIGATGGVVVDPVGVKGKDITSGGSGISSGIDSAHNTAGGLGSTDGHWMTFGDGGFGMGATGGVVVDAVGVKGKDITSGGSGISSGIDSAHNTAGGLGSTDGHWMTFGDGGFGMGMKIGHGFGDGIAFGRNRETRGRLPFRDIIRDVGNIMSFSPIRFRFGAPLIRLAANRIAERLGIRPRESRVNRCPLPHSVSCPKRPCSTIESCAKYPHAVCLDDCEMCTPRFFLGSADVTDACQSNNILKPGGDKCPPFLPRFPCLINPCKILKKCPRHPEAICKPNHCGGCHSRFYIKGKEVTESCYVFKHPIPIATDQHLPGILTVHHQPDILTDRHQPDIASAHHQPDISTANHQPDISSVHYQTDIPTHQYQVDPPTFHHQTDIPTPQHQVDPPTGLHQTDISTVQHQVALPTVHHQPDIPTVQPLSIPPVHKIQHHVHHHHFHHVVDHRSNNKHDTHHRTRHHIKNLKDLIDNKKLI